MEKNNDYMQKKMMVIKIDHVKMARGWLAPALRVLMWSLPMI
jgi:hypothetical protein